MDEEIKPPSFMTSGKEPIIDKDHPEYPFHALDHHWWQKEWCEEYQKWPRGLRIHWRYWNDFKKETDFGWWYRLIYCRILRTHKMIRVWRHNPPGGPVVQSQMCCYYCARMYPPEPYYPPRES